MESIIYCKTNNLNKHSILLKHNGRNYNLFSQEYHSDVASVFSKGVSIHNVFKLKKSYKQKNVIKTISKLNSHIKFLEFYYNLAVFDNTKNKNIINKKKKNINSYKEIKESIKLGEYYGI